MAAWNSLVKQLWTNLRVQATPLIQIPSRHNTRCMASLTNSQIIQQSSNVDSSKKQKEAPKDVNSAKIRIVMKSFVKKFIEIPSLKDFRKVGLPKRRILYTVLRSPHIDKKSREQFEMRIHKQLLETETTPQEMMRKFFWLKRMRLLGAQYEFTFYYKTRLDLSRVGQKDTPPQDVLKMTNDAAAGKRLSVH
uniref:Small ribosomal subunit protein uS10 domain-containing protein n=1 Tax=Araucaria cunninghamii TaxID=56994 RepID=A0A0D6R547_ARACU